MKRYILVLTLALTACSGAFSDYLHEYKNLDLSYKNESDRVTKPQADSRENLSPFGEKHDWQADGKPPQTKPFELETFHGDNSSFRAKNQPLVKTKEINNDELLTQILKCYPERSLFNGELKLKTSKAINRRDRYNNENDNYYSAIVFEMPLYSASETTRKLDRERQRRTETAEILANFSKSVAERNQAERMVSLYRTLEKRSRERVKLGIIEADEQISFLEKTAQAHTKLITTNSNIVKYRLQLVSLCEDSKAPVLNDFLKRISGEARNPQEFDLEVPEGFGED
ncbi:hypothetical protein MY776_09240 [Haemophilus influenzae]|uniref:hypothetical protein n=1 Tax=Haemophilus influenzae TaxID=727 RepID=UPI000E345EF9|nr:hypothetical protein [Haemophilus influenzae]MCK8932857.1 hypothetical protein [Haemophilus influenzae]RFO65745.1 hypothetical protein CH569_09295 [Haemophilus influenzae]RFO69850.1 hypothetical protein CH568_09235 [Haemophilus influenzae]